MGKKAFLCGNADKTSWNLSEAEYVPDWLVVNKFKPVFLYCMKLSKYLKCF